VAAFLRPRPSIPIREFVLVPLIALAIVVLCGDRARTVGAPIVTMIDLGTLGGTNSYASAINSNGQVAGRSQTADGQYHAFIWSATAGMVDLGTLAGPDTIPTAMNNSGQVVGASGDQAFSWTAANGMVSLGPIEPWPAPFAPPPRAVNDAGQVAANNSASCPDRSTAFVWTLAGGKVIIPGFIPLDPNKVPCPAGATTVYGVNNAGQAVGKSIASAAGTPAPYPFPIYHAFLWSPATGLQDLGTLETAGTATSIALGVNDSGQVVGYDLVASYNPYPLIRAFFWSPATGMIDVGPSTPYPIINVTGRVAGTAQINHFVYRAFTWTLSDGRSEIGDNSAAVGMNNTGQIVGSNNGHAFSWTSSAGIVDLGTLGGAVSEARAVNNAGQIAGSSYLSGNAVQHAVIWQGDPTQLLLQLITATGQAGFQQGSRLLENALTNLNRHNTAAACNQMGAFINQVQAQRDKSIPAALADQWVASATQIRGALGCR
jgi:probable HAF family extracellular repeat protein